MLEKFKLKTKIEQQIWTISKLKTLEIENKGTNEQIKRLIDELTESCYMNLRYFKTML